MRKVGRFPPGRVSVCVCLRAFLCACIFIERCGRSDWLRGPRGVRERSKRRRTELPGPPVPAVPARISQSQRRWPVRLGDYHYSGGRPAAVVCRLLHAGHEQSGSKRRRRRCPATIDAAPATVLSPQPLRWACPRCCCCRSMLPLLAAAALFFFFFILLHIAVLD